MKLETSWYGIWSNQGRPHNRSKFDDCRAGGFNFGKMFYEFNTTTS